MTDGRTGASTKQRSGAAHRGAASSASGRCRSRRLPQRRHGHQAATSSGGTAIARCETRRPR